MIDLESILAGSPFVSLIEQERLQPQALLLVGILSLLLRSLVALFSYSGTFFFFSLFFTQYMSSSYDYRYK